VSPADFTVNPADVRNIQYFLISDGGDDSRTTAAEISGPLMVILISDGSWAVAVADASGMSSPRPSS
jgi:hypothetical protein